MNFAKIFILFLCFCTQIFAQQVTLYRVNVEGNTTTSDKMIKYSAGLRDGTQTVSYTHLTLPTNREV